MLRVMHEAHLEILRPKTNDLATNVRGGRTRSRSAYITDFRGRASQHNTIDQISSWLT